MKKWFVVGLSLLAIIYYFLSPSFGLKSESKVSPEKQSVFDGNSYYEFTDLPEGVVAQSGEFQVLISEIKKSAPMKELLKMKNERLFSLIYSQFVTKKNKQAQQILFSFKELSRPPKSILNQFGIPVNHQGSVRFLGFDKSLGLAKIDGKLIKASDIDYNNFIWAAYKTDLFQYQLSAIDQSLKRKIINSEAKKLDLPILEYKEKHIYKELNQEVSDQEIQNYIKKYNMQVGQKSQDSAKRRLLEIRKERAESYIVEKYIMELPVQIDLEKPTFTLVGERGDSPWIGDQEASLEMVLLSDTKSSQASSLIKDIQSLVKKYKDIHFSYRPLFLVSDRMQDLMSQAHFCVWMKDNEKFWPFFNQTIGNFKDKTQKQINKVIEEVGVDVEVFNECLIAQESKKMIDDYLEYARSIGIALGPVLYINGEVLYGNIEKEGLEEVIQRKLNTPFAGVW